MNEDTRFVFVTLGVLGGMVIIISLCIVFSTAYLDKQQFEHNIKCKELGGTYIKENYEWICK